MSFTKNEMSTANQQHRRNVTAEQILHQKTYNNIMQIYKQASNNKNERNSNRNKVGIAFDCMQKKPFHCFLLRSLELKKFKDVFIYISFG